MPKILVSTENSESSLQAVRHAARLARDRPGMEVHLLHVQPRLPSVIGSFVDRGEIRRFHDEEGAAAMASACALLERSGVPFRSLVAVGRPAEEIASYAALSHCDQIVMGAQAPGLISDFLLGSMMRRVLQISGLPVTVVK
jgi:nucleotide-binding universal stress UspA family protein